MQAPFSLKNTIVFSKAALPRATFWGIVLTSKNIANFIGVATVSKKLAVAQYSNGAWTKIM